MPVPESKTVHDKNSLHFWSREQLLEMWRDHSDLKMLADACRLNALTAIQCAGSGHIGTSLSSLDLMVATRKFLEGESFLSGPLSSRIFFSSKGHDAPALYATMHLMGQLTDDDLFMLRRLGGLPGHPETVTPGVPTNTGSLGMGISKAKGFIKAQRLADPASRTPVVVLLGDGELNEGQIWESLPGAVKEGFTELIAIVDSNKIQSDTWTESTLPMGDLRARVEGAGWAYRECDGHSPDELVSLMHTVAEIEKPVFIVANTVKGAGVPWMEAFPGNGEYYKFHSGALAPELYEEAAKILISRVTGVGDLHSSMLPDNRPEFDAMSPKARPETLLGIWEKTLHRVMSEDKRIVVLDGDLSYDTGTHRIRHEFPSRYIQAGIAEQDMVSMAGTIALSGHVPIVHSFSTFLTMRATEQIFNNATEYSPVIYVGFLAGLVPSAPGFSHQAVTDVGIMATIPGMRIFEPSCHEEVNWAIDQALEYGGPSYIRMGTVPPLEPWKGTIASSGLNQRVKGRQVAIVASGPLLAQEAISAALLLQEQGLAPSVFTRTEIGAALNSTEIDVLSSFDHIVILENFITARAQAFFIRQGLEESSSRVVRLGIDGIPANGQPSEVLAHHGLDFAHIAKFVEGTVK